MDKKTILIVALLVALCFGALQNNSKYQFYVADQSLFIVDDNGIGTPIIYECTNGKQYKYNFVFGTTD